MPERARLLDGYFDLLNPLVIQTDISDLAHQPFDEHRFTLLDMADDRLGDRAVVHRIDDVIRDGRVACVDPQSCIDSDILLVDPFVRVDPNDPRDNEIRDLNPVQLHGGRVEARREAVDGREIANLA